MSEPQSIRFSVPEEGFDLSRLPEAARQRGREAFREAVTSSYKDAYREACQPTPKTEPLSMGAEPIQKRDPGVCRTAQPSVCRFHLEWATWPVKAPASAEAEGTAMEAQGRCQGFRPSR